MTQGNLVLIREISPDKLEIAVISVLREHLSPVLGEAIQKGFHHAILLNREVSQEAVIDRLRSGKSILTHPSVIHFYRLTQATA